MRCRILVSIFLFTSVFGFGREGRAFASGAPPGLQSDPALAAAPGGVLAVWTDTGAGPGSRLYWTRIENPVPDTAAAPVTGTGTVELAAAVASGGAWSLAAWEGEGGGGFSALLAAELPPGPPGPVPAVEVTPGYAPVRRPAVAAGESLAVLVWEDERAEPGDVYFARWRPGAGLLDPGGIPLAGGPADQRWPRVAGGPDRFAVVWSERQENGSYRVVAQALDSGGDPLGPAAPLSSPGASATWPDVSFAAGRFLAIWMESGAEGDVIGGAFLDLDGSPDPGGPFAVATSPGLEASPRVSGGDAGFALVWLDLEGSGRSLRRSWVDPLGVAHPREGSVLVPAGDWAADPAVAVRGDSAWIAWRRPLPEDEDDLFLAVTAIEDTAGVPEAVLLTRVGGGLAAGDLPSNPKPAAYPNPFRDRVRIRAPASPGGAALRIVDVRGRVVATIPPSPWGEWSWDGRDLRGSRVPPGVYWARGPVAAAAVRLVRVR